MKKLAGARPSVLSNSATDTTSRFDIDLCDNGLNGGGLQNVPMAGRKPLLSVERNVSAEDPFFRLTNDSIWNACIGRQGDEENYVEGYLEAASELASAVIDKKLYGKRDTLVLPILYNARHAIELTLKFVIARLFEANILSQSPRLDHDIQAHWQLLTDANIGDEELRQCISELEPFVKSLSRVDDDGQELRYHLNREEEPSLATYSLANLEVIRASLTTLSGVASAIRYRTPDYIREYRSGACTKKLSRNDLITIAKALPQRNRWKEQRFDECKTRIKGRFVLSNHQFSDALDVIQKNREMKVLIGQETTLQYLPDNVLIWVVQQWRKRHPKGQSQEPTAVKLDDQLFAEMLEDAKIQDEVVSALEVRLTTQQIAEMEVIFYFGRDGGFPEQYEEQIERRIEQHTLEDDPQRQLRHLMDKTNFLDALLRALPRLGRPSLADQLSHS
ncbi:hypothetical protein ACVIHC_004592 [Bradyrhizobium diazoefficiens]